MSKAEFIRKAYEILSKDNNIKKIRNNAYFNYLKWGGISGSNRCITEPQSAVLTTSPIPPFVKTYIFYQ